VLSAEELQKLLEAAAKAADEQEYEREDHFVTPARARQIREEIEKTKNA
jgi:hypothetical protein